jgi:ribosomal protein S18 acetylase RimI-like enzyme
MDPVPFGTHPVAITKAADMRWHAVQDDRVAGRAEAWYRPDGRLFVSVDSWTGAVFDQLADAALADLPRPLYTMIDETDTGLASHWTRAGFRTRRRELEYLVPTDPRVTGLGSAQPPSDVMIVPAGDADEDLLRQLARQIHDQVEAATGWREMPAEMVPRPAGSVVADPSKYAVASRSGHYVGLLRMSALTRLPRIGLIAVLSGQQRRGIARALLAQVLGSLHEAGISAMSAEAGESNQAGTELFDGIGGRHVGSNLELELPAPGNVPAAPGA